MNNFIRPISHSCQNDGLELGFERQIVEEQEYLDAFLIIDLTVDPQTTAVSGSQRFIYNCSGCGLRETYVSPRGHTNTSDALSYVIPNQAIRGFVPKLDPDQAREFHDRLGSFTRLPIISIRDN